VSTADPADLATTMSAAEPQTRSLASTVSATAEASENGSAGWSSSNFENRKKSELGRVAFRGYPVTLAGLPPLSQAGVATECRSKRTVRTGSITTNGFRSR